jgi:ABC-type Fe3+-hydroxamate transport system substrate-binding protein
MSPRHLRNLSLGTAFVAFLLGACASKPPDPVNVENTKEESATVVAIDPAKRLLTLSDDTGTKVTIKAGPEIRNFAQIKVGDKVVARYYEAIAATLRQRGDGSGTTQAPVTDSVAGRAEAGAKPGIAAASQTVQTVRITDYDKKSHVVSFYGSDGLARSLPIKTPQGQAFADKLKVGDEVEITYTEALALTVEPAK